MKISDSDAADALEYLLQDLRTRVSLSMTDISDVRRRMFSVEARYPGTIGGLARQGRELATKDGAEAQEAPQEDQEGAQEVPEAGRGRKTDSEVCGGGPGEG